ncbi:MAG: UDP-glucose 4-epimerase GalE [Holosporaceae bacterium]|jgi:UDP-glucose 4-epimerase|nr:UDP-glucose 4-epimerase GalE [Holosporaceae bacterium]
MNILVTGGCGYIGSHVILTLLAAGHEVVVVDNLCNSDVEVVQKINLIADKKIIFHRADIRDISALDKIFQQYTLDCIFHFAGLKSVKESAVNPLEYYDNNVNGTLTLLRAACGHGLHKIVFSSSATVYGDCAIPYREDEQQGNIASPYGRTKQIIENILVDLGGANPEWSIAMLRYFNPIGAHESGLIGENPRGIPNNLLPRMLNVAAGIEEKLLIFGNDYSTPDGTCIRDYIHVMDLASGHLAALDHINGKKGVFVWNLGTGRGYSVAEVVDAFTRSTGIKIPHDYVPRRPGDLAEYWADCSKAERELGWKAKKTLEEAVADSWNFAKSNSPAKSAFAVENFRDQPAAARRAVIGGNNG